MSKDLKNILYSLKYDLVICVKSSISCVDPDMSFDDVAYILHPQAARSSLHFFLLLILGLNKL